MVNEAQCQISGYSKAEMLRLRIPDLDAVESPEAASAHMQKIRELGEDRFETRHRRKDGSVIDVEASIQYRRTDGGRFVCFMRDITARKRAEAALAIANSCCKRRKK